MKRPHPVSRKVRCKPIWRRGHDYIHRVSRQHTPPEYSVRECRIATMAYEAGWKAAKRDASSNRRPSTS